MEHPESPQRLKPVAKVRCAEKTSLRGFYETAGVVKVFVFAFAFVFSLVAFLFLLLFLLLLLPFLVSWIHLGLLYALAWSRWGLGA